MKAANNKIIVRVKNDQKDLMQIGDVLVQMALSYEKNYRERSPVIAEVVSGNEFVKSGDILLCHHNLFYLPSPFHLYDDLFSISWNSTIFAKIGSRGTLIPISGNMFCDRIDIETEFPLPPELCEKYTDKVVVIDGGETGYKNGDILFTRPYSYYEIVYTINGVQKRVHKCHKDMVCGILSD